MEKSPLIVLTGPTSVGKTKLSVKLAKEMGGEIISADSMQVYKGMDIGSAKVTPEEMDNVVHHLIDVLDPKDDFNVFIFKDMCDRIIPEILKRGHIPILVGGTGFYIQAVLRGIEFDENENDDSYRTYTTALIVSSLKVYRCKVSHFYLSSLYLSQIRFAIPAISCRSQSGSSTSMSSPFFRISCMKSNAGRN